MRGGEHVGQMLRAGQTLKRQSTLQGHDRRASISGVSSDGTGWTGSEVNSRGTKCLSMHHELYDPCIIINHDRVACIEDGDPRPNVYCVSVFKMILL